MPTYTMSTIFSPSNSNNNDDDVVNKNHCALESFLPSKAQTSCLHFGMPYFEKRAKPSN